MSEQQKTKSSHAGPIHEAQDALGEMISHLDERVKKLNTQLEPVMSQNTVEGNFGTSAPERSSTSSSIGGRIAASHDHLAKITVVIDQILARLEI